MHVRHTITAVIFLLLNLSFANANDFVCAVDLNNNGEFTEPGETMSCQATSAGQLCPINASQCVQTQTTREVCPLDPGIPCQSGQCSISTQNTTCTTTFPTTSLNWENKMLANNNDYSWFNDKKPNEKLSYWWFSIPPVEIYYCPHDGQIASQNQADCTAACQQPTACIEEIVLSQPTCPSTGGICMDTGGGNYQCSATPCNDLTAVPPEETNPVDDRIYVDDGNRDATGLCLDTIMIFSGRNMQCQKAGVSTAFQSCCGDFDMIMSDSTGSIQEMTLYGNAINGVYTVASAAYAGYAAGTGALQGAQSAIVGFDPTTIAISVAIAVAIDYFINNCKQQDMETGSLNASGMCYQTGETCTKRWTFAGCVQKAKTYCCFNSKLAKIIHEQGRPQLATFQSVNANNCRGFYPEEFQYLDFSQIDLSAYYGDLKHASQNLMQSNIEDPINNFMNNMSP